MKQEASENLTMFMARIKEAATTCEFGDQYDNMVRNRFITGLRDCKISTSLVSDTASATDQAGITAGKILEKATAKESANQSNMAMSSSNVNAVFKKSRFPGRSSSANNPSQNRHSSSKLSSSNEQTVVCTRCTLKGHTQANCRTRCRFCKKVGHIVRQCEAAARKNKTQHFVEGGDPVNHDLDDDDGFSDQELGYLYTT